MHSITRRVFSSISRIPHSSHSLRPISACLPRLALSRQYASVTPFDQQQKALEETEDLEEDDSEFPDLLTPDPLMDLYDSETFPPNKFTPHETQVISRNDPSMFDTYQTILQEKYGLTEEELNGAFDSEEGQNAFAAMSISKEEMRKFHVYNLIFRRVSRQTGKGKVFRFKYVTVLGNGDGLVGYGMGKDLDATTGQRKSLLDAVKNLDYVERFEQRTIWTEMDSKLGGTRILLRPRPVGFGLHTNPYIHQILKAAGIKDCSAKVWGSRNPQNVTVLLFRMLHAGNAPLAMGDGLGGRAKRLDKGQSVRGVESLERERGRKMVNLWTN